MGISRLTRTGARVGRRQIERRDLDGDRTRPRLGLRGRAGGRHQRSAAAAASRRRRRCGRSRALAASSRRQAKRAEQHPLGARASRAGGPRARGRRAAPSRASDAAERSVARKRSSARRLAAASARRSASAGRSRTPAGGRRRRSSEAPHPRPLAGAALAAQPLAQRRHPRRRGVPERRPAVLHVVVERAVDEGDVPERQRDQPEPVIVVVGELGRWERQRVVEQLAAKQRGRPGDRVGDQQRQQVGVVVRAPCPVGVGEHRAVTGDDPGVAVDELRVAELGDQASRACRGASGRPGRRARRNSASAGASASARSKLR